MWGGGEEDAPPPDTHTHTRSQFSLEEDGDPSPGRPVCPGSWWVPEGPQVPGTSPPPTEGLLGGLGPGVLGCPPWKDWGLELGRGLTGLVRSVSSSFACLPPVLWCHVKPAGPPPQTRLSLPPEFFSGPSLSPGPDSDPPASPPPRVPLQCVWINYTICIPDRSRNNRELFFQIRREFPLHHVTCSSLRRPLAGVDMAGHPRICSKPNPK